MAYSRVPVVFGAWGKELRGLRGGGGDRGKKGELLEGGIILKREGVRGGGPRRFFAIIASNKVFCEGEEKKKLPEKTHIRNNDLTNRTPSPGGSEGP